MKDVNEVDHLTTWGFLVGIVFFLALGIFIVYIDVDILRNPHVISDFQFKALLFILALFFSLLLIKHFIKWLARHLNKVYLRRFEEQPGLGNFHESKALSFFPNKKYAQAVLLIHGFAASPQEFNYLIKYLEDNNIPYIAPNIMGFGANTTKLLYKARRQDWYRTADDAYRMLEQVADRVSIIGHSLGAVIALMVAKRHAVDQLILTGPGVYSVPCDLRYKRILSNPFFAAPYMRIIPYLPKTIRAGRHTASDMLDNAVAKRIFTYLALPVNSLREVFLAQDEVDLSAIQCKHLTVIHGKYDVTVDVHKFLAALDAAAVVYDEHCIEESAHNVFEDFDKQESCELVIKILQRACQSPETKL